MLEFKLDFTVVLWRKFLLWKLMPLSCFFKYYKINSVVNSEVGVLFLR